MFTLRFVTAGSRDYRSYSVASYEVHRLLDGGAKIEMSRKLNGQDPLCEYVGRTQKYVACYITNMEGKTIDSVKPADMDIHSPEGTI